MDRDRILDEIRRTAAANGGVALGKARFEQETGISESDWSGRFWARWSDAVVEAGLEPNTMQQPYDRLYLLRRLAEMIEDLGKWPTESERKMYTRNHDGFPNPKTLRRLGNRAEQAAAVLDHADELGVSEEARRICSGVAAELSVQAEVSAELSTARGFVYLLRSGRHYKIGHSNDPSRRAYEVRLQMPEPVTEIHRIETDDPAGIEAYWHQRFAAKRKGGEWFQLDRKDVQAFKRRDFM